MKQNIIMCYFGYISWRGTWGVYLDGIPLNEYYGHGGGYADPNVLIPMELDRVFVYKGPLSALYGNFSRCGTIVYMTKKRGDYINANVKYGSWNTVDIQSALGKTIIADKLSNNTAVQFYRTDGFQSNSKQLYGNGSTRFTYKPTEDLEIIPLKDAAALKKGDVLRIKILLNDKPAHIDVRATCNSSMAAVHEIRPGFAPARDVGA